MNDSPRAVIVGASSGIGAAIARALAGRGMQVALVARRENELNAVADKINDIAGRALARVYPGDVTDFESVPALFDKIVADFGGLDMIVYASGIMPPVGPSEYSFDKDKRIIEVNVLGAMAWLNLAAERFERQKSGTIVGISSIAADRGRRGAPVYNTSKAALDTYLEALRNRLSRLGVHVLTVKPGFVSTDMIVGAKLPPFPRPIGADEAARQVLSALDNGDQIRYVPGIWRLIGFILKHLPSPIMQRVGF
jgi:NAD(P)-dependent dehydrogenase (short-subunit alcohol dehydrogenase family)